MLRNGAEQVPPVPFNGAKKPANCNGFRVAVNVHSATFPASSVAVAVTVLTPNGNCPGAGLYVTVTFPHPPVVCAAG
jgi:hypothetical protein